MFYHNTKLKFPLPAGSPENVAGGIIAASAMPHPNLMRRDFSKAAYLRHHRLFDPQLYLADINTATAAGSVVNLGTYPWFRCSMQAFESGKTGGLPKWKKAQADTLLGSWPGEVATDDLGIDRCVRSCVALQVELGCEAVLLPAPMTREPGGAYEVEAKWLDRGLDACAELRVPVPVYATIALADSVLRSRKPLQNPTLQTITSHVAARDRLNGAYLVISQDSEDPNSWTCLSPDTLLSALVVVDDLARHAGKSVIVNGLGAFGVVAAAVGARVWSSGYYRTQRRIRTSDFDDTMGRTVPRFFSSRLLGDIGVEHDLALIAKHPKLRKLLTVTPASERLIAVLSSGGAVSEVPEWEYKIGTPTAAMAHYNHCIQGLADWMDGLEPAARASHMLALLQEAESNADKVRAIVTERPRSDKQGTKHTEFRGQKVWREVFETWLAASGLDA